MASRKHPFSVRCARGESPSSVLSSSPDISLYHQSMHHLLAYVGLTGYGTTEGRMPRRSAEEKRSIESHFATALASYHRHQDSLNARGLHFSGKRHLLLHQKGEVVNEHSKHSSSSTLSSKMASSRMDPQKDSTFTKDKEDLEDARKNCIRTSLLLMKEEESKDPVDGIYEGEATIFLSSEESVEWKAFLLSFSPKDRHTVVVKRTLSVAFWTAHQKNLCLYCWAPRDACMCTTLQHYADQLRTQVWDSDTKKASFFSASPSPPCYSDVLSAFLSRENSCEKDRENFSACGSTMSCNPLVQVSFLLHAEEVLRGTNTGHVAAFVLGSPVLVWGVTHDDAYFQQILPNTVVRATTPTAETPTRGSEDVNDLPNSELQSMMKDSMNSSLSPSLPLLSGTPKSSPADDITIHWHNVCLYPSADAKTFFSFLEENVFQPSIPTDEGTVGVHENRSPIQKNSNAVPIANAARVHDLSAGKQQITENTLPLSSSLGSSSIGDDLHANTSPHGTALLFTDCLLTSPSFSSSLKVTEHRFHFILLDSTWGQALSLNRHIPPRLPRVTLLIDPNYESLFSALRKRTRLSGVSTLEAASFACEQSLNALGYHEKGKQVAKYLREVMMFYVNKKCVLKRVSVPFPFLEE